jgi:hypothetical protein
VESHSATTTAASSAREALLARAKESSEGAVVPAEWGEVVELEEDCGEFFGRYRGTAADSAFKSAVILLWDEDNAERFIWTCARLDKELERVSPAIGATIAIFRGPNYESKHDKAEGREPTGLGYGVACESNDAPIPGADADDGIPF